MSTVEQWSEDRLREAFAKQGYDADDMANAWPRVQRWLDRGDGVAVYENQDMGHPELGHQQFISYGSEAATLVGDVPPERLPDFPTRINWRYTLVATVRREHVPVDGPYDGPCHDPQCGDSTWDHDCPLPPGDYRVVNGCTITAEPIPQFVHDLKD